MNYQAVESSQIAKIGYEPETETLGIIFHSTKKQKEAGLPGSEYHYSFVNSDTYYALMTASSVGKFFGEHIKPFTEKYPFTKVS